MRVYTSTNIASGAAQAALWGSNVPGELLQRKELCWPVRACRPLGELGERTKREHQRGKGATGDSPYQIQATSSFLAKMLSHVRHSSN